MIETARPIWLFHIDWSFRMSTIVCIIAGTFVFNAVPHIVKGICGEKHMSPFGRQSAPWINVLWGWFNLILGAIFAVYTGFPEWNTCNWIEFSIGGIVTSIGLAIFWANPDAKLPWHKD